MVLGDEIILDFTPEEQLVTWPFKADMAERLETLVERNDDDGNTWTTLYEHRSKTESYEQSRGGLHSFRQQEFRFVLYLVIAKADRPRLARFLSDAASLEPDQESQRLF
jgi:hypothetical protein